MVLSLGRPNILEQAISLRKTVQGIVTLATSTDKSAQCINLVLTGVAAVLVNFADRDLYGGVVVGFDDAVGGAALAGHVARRKYLISTMR
jgi:hypothetical protein